MGKKNLYQVLCLLIFWGLLFFTACAAQPSIPCRLFPPESQPCIAQALPWEGICAMLSREISPSLKYKRSQNRLDQKNNSVQAWKAVVILTWLLTPHHPWALGTLGNCRHPQVLPSALHPPQFLFSGIFCPCSHKHVCQRDPERPNTANELNTSWGRLQSKARTALQLGAIMLCHCNKINPNAPECINYAAGRNAVVNGQTPSFLPTITALLAGGIRNASLIAGSWTCTLTPSILKWRSLKSTYSASQARKKYPGP